MFKCLKDHFNISEDFMQISIIIVEHFFIILFLMIWKKSWGLIKKERCPHVFLKDCLIKVTIFCRANPLNLCPAWSRMVEKILLFLAQYRFIENDLKGFRRKFCFQQSTSLRIFQKLSLNFVYFAFIIINVCLYSFKYSVQCEVLYAVHVSYLIIIDYFLFSILI